MKTEPVNQTVIPVPIHPDDKHLPISIVQLKLPSGVVVIRFPMQGRKTIQNIIDTLKIWKPTLCPPEAPETPPSFEI